MTNPYVPHGNDCSYSFPYPSEIANSMSVSGLVIPIREVFEVLARDVDDTDPAKAAFYRRVASHYPYVDGSGSAIDRDGRGSILVDEDDWDDLSPEEKLCRGNINATIAVGDRIRFELEMMDAGSAKNNKVSEIRRALATILEDLL